MTAVTFHLDLCCTTCLNALQLYIFILKQGKKLANALLTVTVIKHQIKQNNKGCASKSWPEQIENAGKFGHLVYGKILEFIFPYI